MAASDSLLANPNIVMELHDIKIAVNVMRARLTVIGFNIAVVSFQLDRLKTLPGGVNLSGLESPIHVGSHVSLLLAIPVSMAAIVGYIFSSRYDEIGICTSWSIVAADILMFMGLALTIAGFFSPLESSMDVMVAGAAEQSAHLLILHDSLLILGGISWFLAAYVGPVRALWQSPFPRVTNTCLAFGYLVIFSYLGLISAIANAIDAGSTGGLTIAQLAIEFVQPLRW
jgi:hypothetical protein